MLARCTLAPGNWKDEPVSELGMAVLWGGIGASSLLIGAWIALRFRPRNDHVGLVMGFGVGAMFAAIAYELVPETSRADTATVVGLLAGALVFYAGDVYIDRRGGSHRKAIAGAAVDPEAEAEGNAIFLGTLLDGIPESFVLGAGLVTAATVDLAFIVAVFVSNLPEAIAATKNMSEAGESKRKIWVMWGSLVAVSALAAGAGYVLTGIETGASGAFVEAFAAGALLAMLVDSMVPEAIKWGGKSVALATVLGFVVSTGLSTFSIK